MLQPTGSQRFRHDLVNSNNNKGRLKREGIYVYIELIHSVVQQKLTKTL